MKRRSFLKGLLGVGVVATVPVIAVAASKPKPIVYDGMDNYLRDPDQWHIKEEDEEYSWEKAMWPGIKSCYGEIYLKKPV